MCPVGRPVQRLQELHKQGVEECEQCVKLSAHTGRKSTAHNVTNTQRAHLSVSGKHHLISEGNRLRKQGSGKIKAGELVNAPAVTEDGLQTSQPSLSELLLFWRSSALDVKVQRLSFTSFIYKSRPPLPLSYRTYTRPGDKFIVWGRRRWAL